MRSVPNTMFAGRLPNSLEEIVHGVRSGNRLRVEGKVNGSHALPESGSDLLHLLKVEHLYTAHVGSDPLHGYRVCRGELRSIWCPRNTVSHVGSTRFGGPGAEMGVDSYYPLRRPEAVVRAIPTERTAGVTAASSRPRTPALSSPPMLETSVGVTAFPLQPGIALGLERLEVARLAGIRPEAALGGGRDPWRTG
jgi:hypothetical protein